MNRFALLCILCSTPAAAELSDSAKLEVAKIQRMLGSVGAASVTLSNSLDLDPHEDRALHASALVAGVATFNNCRQALVYMQAVVTPDERDVATLTREQQLAKSFAEIDACGQTALAFASALEVIPSSDPIDPADFATTAQYNYALSQRNQLASVAAPAVRASKAALDTFDRGLDYGQTDSRFAPRLVGPHGDYDSAQFMAHGSIARFTLSLAAVAKNYQYTPVYTQIAKDGLREHVRYIAPALVVLSRVSLMDLRIVEQKDRSKILSDQDESSRIRDEDFFRVHRQGELLAGDSKHHPYIMGYRPTENGATGSFQVGLGEYVRAIGALVAANDDAADLEMFAAPSLGTIDQMLGARSYRGTVKIAMTAGIQGWQMFDHWFFSIFGFFHGMPLPPE
jgi:hypothetical protein